jgi:hypothetical protein
MFRLCPKIRTPESNLKEMEDKGGNQNVAVSIDQLMELLNLSTVYWSASQSDAELIDCIIFESENCLLIIIFKDRHGENCAYLFWTIFNFANWFSK